MGGKPSTSTNADQRLARNTPVKKTEPYRPGTPGEADRGRRT
jgi:hypothetical protein